MKLRLDQLIVRRGLVESRERAQALILAGQVDVDGHGAVKAGTMVSEHAEVRVLGPEHPWVSRGGVKLAHALDTFAVAVAGRTALDVGASTGGFTDVLLTRGARLVVAVDVGYGQLAWPVRSDERVTVLDRTNVRDLTAELLPYAPDLVVGDLQMAFNRLPEARTAYEAALQKGPSSDAVNRLFVIRLRTGEPAEQAVAFVKDWLTRYPHDSAVRFQLSSYYIENGRLAEAITETELLVRREPNNPLMLNNLAWLYSERKDPRALELAERAHRLASEEPAIMDTYGWILFNSGKRDQGLELLRKAAQGAPREGQIQFHFASALAELGQKDEAKQILRDVLGTRRVFVGRDEAVRLLQRLE